MANLDSFCQGEEKINYQDVEDVKSPQTRRPYLEGVGLDAFGFQEVVVCVEGGEFGWQRWKLDESVLGQSQLLQQG